MYKDKKILCIIPARGGSKRLPGKNIKPLNGKPLIAYAIEAAKGSQHIDKIIVSTDDEAIAKVAQEFGAEVPFMRPAELANDTAPTLLVLQHAVAFVESQGETYDYIVLIQPTVPGVLASDIDAVIEKCIQSEAYSCITVSEIIDPPQWMYRMDVEGQLTPYLDTVLVPRSQDLQKLYRINGAAYVTQRETLMVEHKIIDNARAMAVIMPRSRSIDIDTLEDFMIAEHILESDKTF